MMFNQDWMVDVLAKATVILIVASVTDRLITRRPAAMRHRLWSTTLLMLLILPISSAMMPQWRLPILPRSLSSPTATSLAVPNRSDESIQIIGKSSSSQLGTSNLGNQDGSTPSNGNLVSPAVSSTIQLPTGNQRLAVHNSDTYELSAFLGRRHIRIESKPDQANEVTLYLQSKGTDKLGEWDELASVVLGYSAAERRRISALPEVREKMDAFAKQFRDAKTRRGPKVLAEAYTVVAEALAHAGDLKEAIKWHQKAAEQKAKANHQPQ